MRAHKVASWVMAGALVLLPGAVWSVRWEGTLKMGGTVLDEEGDLSTTQETYNVFDGFSLTHVRLNGFMGAGQLLSLDLRQINLGGRQADLLYRVPGRLRFTASMDQHRQVFDAERRVDADRQDWRFGLDYRPVGWLRLSGNLNRLSRDGDRQAFPAGTASVLGDRYDNVLYMGGVTAEARRGARGLAVSYRGTDFNDERDAGVDRNGRVLAVRLFGPSFFYDRWTHLVRAAYGRSELSNRDLDHTLASFQYVGVVRPLDRWQFKYRFYRQQIDDAATNLTTDRYLNLFETTWYHALGTLMGGYAYETNDDERTLTSYHTWRTGATLRFAKRFKASVRYAGRLKKDVEDLTLLADVEASRFRAELEVRPKDRLTLGGGVRVRDRTFTDIDVESDGRAADAYVRYELPQWGIAAVNYDFARDTYRDREGTFEATTHGVTGRVEIERLPRTRLAGGVTYLDIGSDLDIEKSIVFLEGRYDLRKDLHLEVQYNVYNYDDFILLDRYYTANVVWMNVAYDFQVQ